MSLGQIAQSFSAQTESKNLYPYLADPLAAGFNGTQAFVDAIYKNLFNRLPDAAGESYWTGQLINGVSTAGNAILNIIGGATGNDLLTVNNKLTVGNYSDSQLFASPSAQFVLASAQAALIGVTSLSTSVSAGKNNVDALVRASSSGMALDGTASHATVDLVGISTASDPTHIA